MILKKLLLLLVVLTATSITFAQTNPPEEFFKGLNLTRTNDPQAKKFFLIAVNKSPAFHGSYNFLGVIYTQENKLDSAIFYLKKAIELNPANANHTTEFTYDHLVDVYLLKNDFENSYKIALEGYKRFPESPIITTTLKDLCMWSFYIKEDGLDKSYLSPDIKPEYIVNSINQEYLIVRRLRINNERLVVQNQSLVTKDKSNYDVLTCIVLNSKESVKINFKLNWDMNKYFGGKTTATQPVIDGTQYPIYERLGAMFVGDNKTVVKTALEKLNQ